MQPITVSTLAHAYGRGEDRTANLEYHGFAGLWRSLVQAQYVALVKQTGVTVRFVSGQPFDTAEEMLNHIAEACDLPISTDFNESALSGAEGNLRFRAAHDLSHYLCDLEHRAEGVRCNFALDGETRAFERQARHLLALYASLYWTRELVEDERCYDRERIIQVAFSEVVLQAAYFYAHGDFAEQKVVLAGVEFVNRWLAQCNLPALAV